MKTVPASMIENYQSELCEILDGTLPKLEIFKEEQPELYAALMNIVTENNMELMIIYIDMMYKLLKQANDGIH